MRILRIADVPNNVTGGMSRIMYATGEVLKKAGHRVDYLFTEELGPVSPRQLRRFVIPWRLPELVARRQERWGSYDVIEIHEPLAAGYVYARRRNRSLPPRC